MKTAELFLSASSRLLEHAFIFNKIILANTLNNEETTGNSAHVPNDVLNSDRDLALLSWS